ncbi:hypothetical protein Gpo141_00000906 [Globisporangium polare]
MLNSEAPADKHLKKCAECHVADSMVWSMKLNDVGPATSEKHTEASNKSKQQKHDDYQATIKYQAAVISGLIEMNKRRKQRIEAGE